MVPICGLLIKSSSMSLFASIVVILMLSVVLYKANPPCEFLNDWSLRSFYKVRKCHRSNQPVISRANVRSLRECMDFAKERGGLALNFSPPGASISKYYQDYYFVNCQVLGCPEIGNSTLVNDITFDYYSFFGDLDALVNTSCIKSAGLFQVFQEKVNYTTAIMNCQEMGGDLAHIVSEARTNGISTLVKNELTEWYKIAYVGLDDSQRERRFETPMGEPLNCFKFRAWGPGQPRNKEEHDDCVIIDSENAWKVINCQEELPFVCEMYPMAPPKETNLQNVTCSEIKDKDKRKKCQAKNEEQKIAEKQINVTATDRCKGEL